MVIRLTEIEKLNLLSERAYNRMCLLCLGAQEKKKRERKEKEKKEKRKRKKEKTTTLTFGTVLLGLINLYLSSESDTRSFFRE